MAHHATASIPDQQAVPEFRHRCACCEGIIENLASETLPTGLNLRLSLFSDECALICNACTSRLVEANRLNWQSAKRRR